MSKPKPRPTSEYDPAVLLGMLDNMFDESLAAPPVLSEDLLDDETRAAAAALEAEFSFDNIMDEVLAEKAKKEALEQGGLGGQDDDGDELRVNIEVRQRGGNRENGLFR